MLLANRCKKTEKMASITNQISRYECHNLIQKQFANYDEYIYNNNTQLTLLLQFELTQQLMHKEHTDLRRKKDDRQKLTVYFS